MATNKETLKQALVDNAVTAPEVDTDTLTDRIAALLDNDPAGDPDAATDEPEAETGDPA